MYIDDFEMLSVYQMEGGPFPPEMDFFFMTLIVMIFLEFFF